MQKPPSIQAHRGSLGKTARRVLTGPPTATGVSCSPRLCPVPGTRHLRGARSAAGSIPHASIPPARAHLTSRQPHALSHPPRQIPRRKQSLKQQGYLARTNQFPQSTSHAVRKLTSQHLSGERSQPAVTPHWPPFSTGAKAQPLPHTTTPSLPKEAFRAEEEKGFGANCRTSCSWADRWEHLGVKGPPRAWLPAAMPLLSSCDPLSLGEGQQPPPPRLALCGCCLGCC